jgi:hypothetical protein
MKKRDMYFRFRNSTSSFEVLSDMGSLPSSVSSGSLSSPSPFRRFAIQCVVCLWMAWCYIKGKYEPILTFEKYDRCLATNTIPLESMHERSCGQMVARSKRKMRPTCINLAIRVADLSVKLHPTNAREEMEELDCKPGYRAVYF